MSSQSPSATRRRAVALTAAAALGSALLLPAPAAQGAEEVPLTLAWEISEQFDDHLGSHALAGGATESEDGVITFPGGEGSFDPATGEVEVAYAGSVQGAFSMAPGSYIYQVTFAEPVVTVDAEGNGEISAVVSADVPSQSASAAPTRVVVTTFDAAAGDWAAADGVGTLTDTPDWAGVLPEGEASTALGIPAGQPVEGKAWAPTLLGHLPQGLRAHFYASGSGSDPKKAPAAFTLTADQAAAPEPAVEVAPVAASGRGVELSVSGTGFTDEVLPGGNGAYVGLAPAGGVPDGLSMEEGIAYFADVEWVMPGSISGGAFAAELAAGRAKLDPRKDYAVYVWPGHTSWSAESSTETPVEVDWDALGFPLRSKVAIKVAKKPAPKKAGKAVVTVRGAHVTPFGKVTVKWGKGKKTTTLTPRLRNGQATIRLPKSAKGKWKLVAKYAGNPVYRAARKAVTVKVARR